MTSDYARGFRAGVEAAAKESERDEGWRHASTAIASRIRSLAPPSPEPATPVTEWRRGWSIPPAPAPGPESSTASNVCATVIHNPTGMYRCDRPAGHAEPCRFPDPGAAPGPETKR